MRMISVARDFTRFPSGRYKRHSKTSGEEFRERFLLGPLRDGEPITVDLDGTIGFGSSFLEEAFGGAAREVGKPASDVLALLHFKSSDEGLVNEIRQYIIEAAEQAAGLH